jgi:hypothetical protein
MSRFHDLLNSINNNIKARMGCGSDCEEYEDYEDLIEDAKQDLEDKLELETIKRKLKELRNSKAEDGDFLEIEEMEVETIEQEMNEYKKDFYNMSVGSLKAIMTHAQNILSSLENPSVAENLTESWLQGKIAVTEDYMRTIHDFVMFVSDAADNISGSDRPGLWENIRRKKERMGKKYRPAKPGDKDRPNPEQWNKLTKKDK